MLEMLVFIAIVVSVLAVVYGVMKWAARLEVRALRRQEMRHVYYLRGDRPAGVKAFKRRFDPECDEASEWFDDTTVPQEPQHGPDLPSHGRGQSGQPG